MVIQRNLYFSLSENTPRVSGVRVPQGRVLSTLLFSLETLRNIKDVLPDGVEIIMFADDIILYVSNPKIETARDLLQQSYKDIK